MKPPLFTAAVAVVPPHSRIGDEAVPQHPSHEPERSYDYGAHVEGIVVEGAIKPCTYIYELRAGRWHWLGWNDELNRLQELRSKCGIVFRTPKSETLLLYGASPIPRVNQTLCVNCKLPQDEAPPTLYVGDRQIKRRSEPSDSRKAADKWTLRNRWQRWRQRRRVTTGA